MTKAIIQLGWVKPAIIEQLKGVSIAALDGKRKNHKMREGYHWRKADDGNVYWHFERFDDYVENGIGI